MESLIRLDEFLISKCQKLADWFTKTTGIGSFNYKLAYFFLSLFVGLMLLIIAILYEFSFVSMVFVFGLLLLGTLLKKMLEHKASQEHDNFGETKTINIVRSHLLFRFIRLIFLIVVPLATIEKYVFGWYDPSHKNIFAEFVIFTACHIVFALYLYFLACDKLPPRCGRVQEWLSSFGRQPVPVRIKQNRR